MSLSQVRSHPCLFCKVWVREDRMIQHLGDVHGIKAQVDAPEKI